MGEVYKETFILSGQGFTYSHDTHMLISPSSSLRIAHTGHHGTLICGGVSLLVKCILGTGRNDWISLHCVEKLYVFDANLSGPAAAPNYAMGHHQPNNMLLVCFCGQNMVNAIYLEGFS